MTKLTVARALTAQLGKRFIKLATIITVGVFVVVLIVAGVLAYFFSAWWWLLIIPFIPLVILFFLLRLVVLVALRRIHGEHMNQRQRQALDEFIDKIQMALEARATPLPIIALISIKDLVLHRDITTVKKVITDTAGLRSDYAALEKLF